MSLQIVVIDGQGGGIGRQVVQQLKARYPGLSLTAVGTNSIASAAMLKAGAERAATGENAVVVCCRTADIIIGPAAVVIADSLLGEITPKMAAATGQSSAVRILIPVNGCNNIIAGMGELPVGRLVEAAVEEVGKIIRSQSSEL